VIIGISKDNEKSHQKFIKKIKIPFILLCGTDYKVAEKYGVQRLTFVIDEKGKLEGFYPTIAPKGHSEEVLRDL